MGLWTCLPLQAKASKVEATYHLISGQMGGGMLHCPMAGKQSAKCFVAAFLPPSLK